MRALLCALVLLALAAGCGGDDGGDEPSTTEDACERVEAPQPRDAPSLALPRGTLDPGKEWALVLETSCGTFTVALDLALAPETTASLVFLAREGFYDDTVFHRIVPGFVIQGGDPTQTGTGGPGYATLDAPPTGFRYAKGIVAMAKSGFEPAGTAGSQFFVVTGESVNLPPDYAVVGRVEEGLEVVERIGELGDENEQPTQPVVVRNVSVTES